MPSWKKVIISGSAAELSSVFAPSITGSLQGTASFAVTASYALTSSFSLATSANQILGINKSGFTITKGTVVHLTGSTNSSDTPYITTASYESDNLSANTLGIAAETITFNSTGYITTEGVLTGLNVTEFVSGQVVYLGASGSITGSAPIAPLHSVRLGQVVRDSPTNNGSIYVRIDNGYEIGELHDVIDSTTNTSYGDLLVKSGSVWNTGKQLTGPYGVTGSFSVKAPGAGGIILDTDINSDTLSSRLFFKISGSGRDISMRNSNGSLFIGHSATALNATGTSTMIISSSGVAIGDNYTISAGRGAALQVSGSINIEQGFAYKQDGRNVIYITPGTSPVTTTFTNTIAGELAAEGTAYFDHMTAFGYSALYQSSGSDNTAVGYAAGSGYSGSSSTLIGWGAGLQAKASNQTAVGENAGAYNTGSSQTAVGYQAGYLNTGSNQTAIGNSAGWKNTATQQTAVGVQAGYLNIGVTQTALGQQAGQSNSGSTQTAVGYASGFQNSGSLQVAIGAQAGRDNKGDNQTATGYEAGRLNIGANQVAMGNSAGESNSGNNQTAIGSQAGYLNTGSNQTAVGSAAGYQNSGSDQVVSGYRSGYQNKGDDQTATGYEAGYLNTGAEQSAFGWRSGYQNSGANMTAIGSAAGYQNSGSGLVAVGVDAGRTNKGTQNTFIGFQAGYFTTGATVNTASTQSVFLGGSTTAGGASRTNQIVIGYNAEGIGSNSVVLGNSSILTTALRGFVGIGTTAPTKIFEVVSGSNTAYFDLTATAGPLAAVVTSDFTKLARFNASDGTNSISVGLRSSAETANPGFGEQNDTYIYANSNANGLNIINAAGTGTADYIKFFAGKVATETPSMIIIGSGSSKGNVGIGTTTPLASLHVTGSAIISGSMVIGSGSLGASENTLTLGAKDNGSEGGQLGLNAPGGTYTSASMIDNYQNRFRILRGTNATSDAEYFNLNLHSGQVTFNKYSGSGAFPGTAAGYLAFDSAGNILTTAGVAAAPGGNDTEVQFNNGGALAGTPIMRIVNSTIQISSSTNITGSITIGSDTNTNLDPRGFVYGSGSYLNGIASNDYTTYSAILGGTFNKINTDGTRNVILGGTTNTITGSGDPGGHNDSAIIGGSYNTIDSSSPSEGELIAASYSSSIKDGQYISIIASSNCDIDGSSGFNENIAMIACVSSSINSEKHAVIIGGEKNTFQSSSSRLRSVILGGSNITGSKSDTVYMPNAHVTGSFESPAGNTIASNALIQAGLLYLSNNF